MMGLGKGNGTLKNMAISGINSLDFWGVLLVNVNLKVGKVAFVHLYISHQAYIQDMITTDLWKMSSYFHPPKSQQKKQAQSYAVFLQQK